MEKIYLSLIGFVLGVISSLLKNIVIDNYKRPKIEIDLDESIHLTCYSVKISNAKNRKAAINCTGSITLNLKESSGFAYEDKCPSIFIKDFNEKIIPRYRSRNNAVKSIPICVVSNETRGIKNELLCWAYIGNPSKLTINPQNSSYLDLFRYYNNENNRYLIIPTELGWGTLRAVIKLKEEFKITGKITVSAENSPVYEKSFVLKDDKIIDKPNNPGLGLDFNWANITKRQQYLDRYFRWSVETK